jgi:hypothetical protein
VPERSTISALRGVSTLPFQCFTVLALHGVSNIVGFRWTGLEVASKLLQSTTDVCTRALFWSAPRYCSGECAANDAEAHAQRHALRTVFLRKARQRSTRTTIVSQFYACFGSLACNVKLLGCVCGGWGGRLTRILVRSGCVRPCTESDHLQSKLVANSCRWTSHGHWTT